MDSAVIAKNTAKPATSDAERPLEYRFVADAMATFLAYRAEWSKPRWGVASNMTPRAAEDLEKARAK